MTEFRTGEKYYFAIVRNRSGQDSGELDFGIAFNDVMNLDDIEFKEMIELIERALKRLKNDYVRDRKRAKIKKPPIQFDEKLIKRLHNPNGRREG